MKLLITVEGNSYEVDVQVLDEGQAPAPTSAPPRAAAAPQTSPAPPPRTASASPQPSPAPAASAGGESDVPSPVAGTVQDIRVKAGDTVEVNDTLLVLEAMKMESNVASPTAGTVKEVCVSAGDTVTAGQVLVKF